MLHIQDQAWIRDIGFTLQKPAWLLECFRNRIETFLSRRWQSVDVANFQNHAAFLDEYSTTILDYFSRYGISASLQSLAPPFSESCQQMQNFPLQSNKTFCWETRRVDVSSTVLVSDAWSEPTRAWAILASCVQIYPSQQIWGRARSGNECQNYEQVQIYRLTGFLRCCSCKKWRVHNDNSKNRKAIPHHWNSCIF